MIAAVCIAAHLLSRDDAPPVIFDGEGGFEIPPLPEILDGSEVPGKTRKIIVYQQWPIQSRLLIRVSFPSFISFCPDSPHYLRLLNCGKLIPSISTAKCHLLNGSRP
jgi:hypothetical protein